MAGQRRRRGISAGTVAALAGCALVLVLFLVLILRFGGRCGASYDARSYPTESPAATRSAAAAASVPAGTTAPSGSPAPTPAAERSFTLTAGGTVAMETNVLKAGYYSEAKAYDFDDTFALLQADTEADISLVTMENLVMPGERVNKLTAPAEVMRMLRRGGFGTVAIGFPAAGERGAAGLRSTREAALSAGLRPIGAFSGAAEAEPAAQIVTVNGVRVAILHYIMSPSSTSKSKLKKDNASDLLPLTDQAVDEVRAARAAGAEVVIVSLHWGSRNSSAPTKAQRQLAQSLADAGADVLIGTGSRRVQTAEWLTASGEGGNSRTLCIWSLGCLISDSRDNNAVAGMLLHLRVTVSAGGAVDVEAAYTPTFVWRYDVGSVDRYQVVSALRDPPDAMNTDQVNALKKARTRIEDRMNGAPLYERMPQ